MDPSKFRSLLNSPESATLAGFEVADSIAIAETYCAMSNSDGGQIMVGVRREEAVYGRPDWTPIGILAEEEPGQIIRKLESQIDEKGASISFDLVALTQDDRNTPERTVLIIVAKKIGNPKNRMSINGGKVFLRRGAQNIAETALERIERGKSMFRPEQFRSDAASNPEMSAESQPLIASAGVQPPSVIDGISVDVDNWIHSPAPESLPKPSLENRFDKEQMPLDAGGGRFPFDPHGEGLKIGGETRTSFTTSDEGVENISDIDRGSSDTHETDKRSPDSEQEAVNPKDSVDQTVVSAPDRLLFGTQLQISRECSESEEALNCEEHAKVLAAFFDSTIDDVCFGLFGHWGRGKTYLINKVSGILRGELKYEVIRFSAWKYRSTPEVWAHLYETIATASRSTAEPFKSFPLNKILSPYRAMIARYGVWPIIIAYLTFGLSLDTVQDRFRSIEFVLTFLGFTGTVYFVLLFFRLQGFWRKHGSSMSKQPSHRDKLGLQIAIGDDLRALLVGWLPKGYQLDKWKKTTANEQPNQQLGFLQRLGSRAHWKTLGAWSDYKLSLLIPIAVYVAATVFVFFQLVPEEDKTIDLPIFGTVNTGFPPDVINLVYAIWGMISIGLPILAMYCAQGPRRLLLVVDDLDRCEPVQMLEIIESTMLLLDDKEIQKRMQVVMLVEEEAVRAALLMKYSHLRSKNRWSQHFDAAVDDCIVRENLEKFFVSYLRLPEIPPDDFRELLRKYIEQNDGTPSDRIVLEFDVEIDRTLPNRFPRLTDVDAPSDAQPSSRVDSRTEHSQSAVDNGVQTKPVIEYANNLKLSAYERGLLTSRLEGLRTTSRDYIRWGPRTVRSYLHKYRLARALWIALNPKADIDAKALLDALMPVDRSQTEDSDDLLKYIVSQVS